MLCVFTFTEPIDVPFGSGFPDTGSQKISPVMHMIKTKDQTLMALIVPPSISTVNYLESIRKFRVSSVQIVLSRIEA
jgi:hypothetical protein